MTSRVLSRSDFLQFHISVPIKTVETTLNKVAEYKFLLRFKGWLKAIEMNNS